MDTMQEEAQDSLITDPAGMISTDPNEDVLLKYIMLKLI